MALLGRAELAPLALSLSKGDGPRSWFDRLTTSGFCGQSASSM